MDGGGATDSTSMRGDENGVSFGAHIEISHKTPHGDLISHPLQLYAYIYIYISYSDTYTFIQSCRGPRDTLSHAVLGVTHRRLRHMAGRGELSTRKKIYPPQILPV